MRVYSDSFGIFFRHLVPIVRPFGQLWDFLGLPCPNPASIRTALSFSSGILSESCVHSDSFGLFLRHPVRILRAFGQLSAFLLSSCPNLVSIRTALRFSSGILSEPCVHSDSFEVFFRHLVRILCPFGQL
jgi:hypothetical protein